MIYKPKWRELLIDLHFTHSLPSDIFNLNSKNGERDGEKVIACMVINKFAPGNEDLVNDDAQVFSRLFPNNKKIMAGPEDAYDNKVTDVKYEDFIKDVKRSVIESEKVSAFGK